MNTSSQSFLPSQARHKPWRIYRWMMALAIISFFVAFLAGVQRVLRPSGAGSAFQTILLVVYANFNILIAFHKVR